MIDFNSQQYFILSTSTDLGKTYFTTKICEKLSIESKIHAIKPLISGFNYDDHDNDSYKILDSLGLDFSENNLNSISPFRLKEPYSPLKAAKMENIDVNFDEICDFCLKNIEKSKENGYNLLIEGAGGVMTPINNDKTFLDLAEKLNVKIILLGGVFLGAISQILCCVEALKSRNIEIEAIIINDYMNEDKNLKTQDIIDEVENFSKIKTFPIAEIA